MIICDVITIENNMNLSCKCVEQITYEDFIKDVSPEVVKFLEIVNCIKFVHTSSS